MPNVWVRLVGAFGNLVYALISTVYVSDKLSEFSNREYKPCATSVSWGGTFDGFNIDNIYNEGHIKHGLPNPDKLEEILPFTGITYDCDVNTKQCRDYTGHDKFIDSVYFNLLDSFDDGFKQYLSESREDLYFDCYTSSNTLFRDICIEKFKPHPNITQYIESKYHPLKDSIGVHIRICRYSDKGCNCEKKCESGCPARIKYLEDAWYKRAIQFILDKFPDCPQIFVFYGNRKNMLPSGIEHLDRILSSLEEFQTKITIIESEPYYIDFFLLTNCTHMIGSESTFYMAASLLNQSTGLKLIPTNNLWPGFTEFRYRATDTD